MDAQRVLPDAPAEEAVAARRATLKAIESLTIAPPLPVVGLIERAQALGLKLPELAKRLQLTPDLLIKLDRGYVQLETVPRRFLAHVAQGLQTTVDALVAGLPTAPRLAAGAAFYTKDRPQTAQQQSFATALQQATALPETERARWLAAAREEGLAA